MVISCLRWAAVSAIRECRPGIPVWIAAQPSARPSLCGRKNLTTTVLKSDFQICARVGYVPDRANRSSLIGWVMLFGARKGA